MAWLSSCATDASGDFTSRERDDGPASFSADDVSVTKPQRMGASNWFALRVRFGSTHAPHAAATSAQASAAPGVSAAHTDFSLSVDQIGSLYARMVELATKERALTAAPALSSVTGHTGRWAEVSFPPIAAVPSESGIQRFPKGAIERRHYFPLFVDGITVRFVNTLPSAFASPAVVPLDLVPFAIFVDRTAAPQGSVPGNAQSVAFTHIVPMQPAATSETRAVTGGRHAEFDVFARNPDGRPLVPSVFERRSSEIWLALVPWMPANNGTPAKLDFDRAWVHATFEVPRAQFTSDGIAESESWLTPRRLDVLREILEGHANARVAHELGISRNTVKNHMTAIMNILGTSSRVEAALTMVANGWAAPSLPSGASRTGRERYLY